MSAPSSPVDPDAEREIDLARIREIVRAQWWVVAVCVVAGIVLGAFYSLSGGSTWEATARIAPGQAFSSAGSPVLSYLTNPAAINAIATSEATIEEAAAKSGVSARQLRGRISTSALNSEGTTTQRNAVLVNITARLNKKKKAEDAANAVARIVQRQTTSRYVRKSVSLYDIRINNFNQRLITLKERVAFLDKALKQPGLSLNESLLLAIQLDQAQANQGQTIDSLTTAQQQQILAEDVSRTQIVQDARGSKSTARSRRNSVLVGALLGLIVGVIAAIVIDRRASRARPA